jgi:RNA recognition motif-containing protein
MDIFIGGLPPTMRQRELQEIFEKYGKVASVNLITDHLTRLNKGFGFVTMPDSNQARSAINALNGVEIDGRKLMVNESKFKKGEGNANAGPAHRSAAKVDSKKSNPPRSGTDRKKGNKRESR